MSSPGLGLQHKQYNMQLVFPQNYVKSSFVMLKFRHDILKVTNLGKQEPKPAGMTERGTALRLGKI